MIKQKKVVTIKLHFDLLFAKSNFFSNLIPEKKKMRNELSEL